MSTQIEKIKSEIYEQAEVELQKIKSETDEKIKIIHDATEKEISKIKQSIEDSNKSNVENQARRDLGKARLQAKMAFLSEKEAGIKAVFDEGKKKITELLQSGSYPAVLNNLIVAAGSSLGGGKLIVTVSKTDASKVNLSDIAQKVTTKTGTQTTVVIDSIELKTKLGGAVIKKDDLWVDNTFEAIVERRNESLRAEIAKILFV